eukprot:TRINITY_DN45810_c0_g1_i1.p1 TRINITY_DN45810_c0_g1~~TRINITY_DN45810_c0_g1_i1.p1  ORF type:complete len:150 (-),score=5.69 TRINITY_DN45810_c0_g1_i1:415-864(-)
MHGFVWRLPLDGAARVVLFCFLFRDEQECRGKGGWVCKPGCGVLWLHLRQYVCPAQAGSLTETTPEPPASFTGSVAFRACCLVSFAKRETVDAGVAGSAVIYVKRPASWETVESFLRWRDGTPRQKAERKGNPELGLGRGVKRCARTAL